MRNRRYINISDVTIVAALEQASIMRDCDMSNGVITGAINSPINRHISFFVYHSNDAIRDIYKKKLRANFDADNILINASDGLFFSRKTDIKNGKLQQNKCFPLGIKIGSNRDAYSRISSLLQDSPLGATAKIKKWKT
jgi:hypothetical protein